MPNKASTRAKRASKRARFIITETNRIIDEIDQLANMIEMIDPNPTEDDLEIIRKAATIKIDEFVNRRVFHTTSQREDNLKIFEFAKKAINDGKHDNSLHLSGVELVKHSLSVFGHERAHKQLQMKSEKRSVEGAEGKEGKKEETGKKIAGVLSDQNFQLTYETQVSNHQLNQASPITSARALHAPNDAVAKARKSRETFWAEKDWDLKMLELFDPELQDPELQDMELIGVINEILKNADKNKKDPQETQ